MHSHYSASSLYFITNTVHHTYNVLSLLCIIITGSHKYIELGSVHQNQSIRISASASGALVHCTRDYWAPVVPGLDYTTLLGAGYWLLGSGYWLLRLYPRMAASASAIHVFIPGKLNFLIAFLFLICSFAYSPIPFVVFYMLCFKLKLDSAKNKTTFGGSKIKEI